jgi:tyrosine-protein kinase Etk/Wzc
MTPPHTFTDAVARNRIVRTPWKRRVIALVLLIIFGLLSFFPERYRMAVTFTPADPASLGLSGTLGQLGAINSVFGNQAAVEVAIKIARSISVREEVIRRLDLVKKLGVADSVEASRWIDSKVTSRTMRGGIIQTEYFGRDPVFGRKLVAAISDTTQQRLALIARRQTAYKRNILKRLVETAGDELDVAQENYNRFRLKTRFSDPTYAISAIGERIPILQAAIKAKEVELATARQFATDDNMSVRQITASIEALQSQLAQYRALNPAQDNSIGSVVTQSTESDRLERKLGLAHLLYDSYTKFLQGTSVEDLTAEANVRVLESPFVDTDRQINFVPAGLAVLVLLMLLAIEFYEWRPPVGDRKVRT